MADPHRSPQDANARRRAEPDAPSRGQRWGVVVAILLVIALLGLIVFLHLNGTIGPGTH
jgi:hypothetical protein